MANTENYKATKTYKEAKEIFENLKNVDVNDKDVTTAVLLFKEVHSTNPGTVVLLENLTGLDLAGPDKLYDYYAKNITFNDDLIAQLAMFQLISLGGDKGINELLDALKEKVS